MIFPEPIKLPDIQSQLDDRNIPIDRVGIKGIRYPLVVSSGGQSVPTIATLSMTVGLSALSKGTHMSRFVELLESQSEGLDQISFKRVVLNMLKRLNANTGSIEMKFPYFVTKSAPVSLVKSRLDYEVCWIGSVEENGHYNFNLQVTVPTTSLCPCSKEISKYGAHNQRSHISINVGLLSEMSIEELIDIAEVSASCELFGLLKRPDEKYVTERAYENPKFVEDLVRDVAVMLGKDERINGFVIEVENFESIHNHSAFARVVKPSAAISDVTGARQCH